MVPGGATSGGSSHQPATPGIGAAASAMPSTVTERTAVTGHCASGRLVRLPPRVSLTIRGSTVRPMSASTAALIAVISEASTASSPVLVRPSQALQSARLVRSVGAAIRAPQPLPMLVMTPIAGGK